MNITQRIEKRLFFGGNYKKKKFQKFSTRVEKKLICEPIHKKENFFLKKESGIFSVVNNTYVDKIIKDINSSIKDATHIDKVIENLYILCVKGEIGLCDERIKYYVNWAVEYVTEYIKENEELKEEEEEEEEEEGGEKENEGKEKVKRLMSLKKKEEKEKYTIDVESYLLFLNVLKVLNIRSEYDSLLKYISTNISLFPISVVRKIAVNKYIRTKKENERFFFKELLKYIYTLVHHNNEFYFKEIDNINRCINVCTHYYFGNEVSIYNNKWHHNNDINNKYFIEDTIYNYDLNFIYITHIVTCGNLYSFHTRQMKHKTNDKDETEKKISYRQFFFPLGKDDNKREEIKSNDLKKEDMSETTEEFSKNIEHCLSCVNDFHFNYYLIDTIYVLHKYYSNLSKRKEMQMEHCFLFLTDIKNSITSILLQFIDILYTLNRSEYLKNRRVLGSFERLWKLSEFFHIPYDIDKMVLHYLSFLVINKIDLSLNDGAKLLALLRGISKKGSTKEETDPKEEKNEPKKEKKTRTENRKTQHKELGTPDSNAFFRSLMPTNGPIEKYSEDPFLDRNQYLQNLVRLIFENLKKNLHHSTGSNICVLIPLIFYFRNYADEEMKNILTVQISYNREFINESNFVNILRVFCKMDFTNELFERIMYTNRSTQIRWSFNEIRNYTDEKTVPDGTSSFLCFSSPKNFFLYFYYKTKNKLFNYKDLYYVENYIENTFCEMNVLDFRTVLLIYYKNKIYFVPELLLKIGKIINNMKKDISIEELLFCCYLLTKNYLYLSRHNSIVVAEDTAEKRRPEERMAVLNRINIYRKSQYHQHHANEFIKLINDILYHIYNEKRINFSPEQIRHLKEKELYNEEWTDIHNLKRKNEKHEIASEVKTDENDPSGEENTPFKDMRKSLIMMKIFYNIYYPLFSIDKEKKISNDHHYKLMILLFNSFNKNYFRKIEEAKYVSPLLFYFSYFNFFSSFYFEKQLNYVLNNCIMDNDVIKHVLLSHVYVNKKLTQEIQTMLKQYVEKHIQTLPLKLQILCFKYANTFLNTYPIEEKGEKDEVRETNQNNNDRDLVLFTKILNSIFMNIGQMTPSNCLILYVTICNYFLKNKKYYIQLFYYMNKYAIYYNNEQLFLILLYMYKTGYSKPKIRKKIRNLILFRCKKRQVDFTLLLENIMPLDEFGIFHLLPIKLQVALYNQLDDTCKSHVRPPLTVNSMKSSTNVDFTSDDFNTGDNEQEKESLVTDEREADTPSFIFQQMVKNF